MSWDLQTTKIEDITNKWELAQRIAGHAKVPEQALTVVFAEAMEKLEGFAKTKFETSMKDRVWKAVSGVKLKTLKETFILEVCEKILGGFTDDEAGEMLREHQRTGAVKNKHYTVQLQKALALHESAVHAVVVEKANSMILYWIPEIVEAVKKEGFVFPKPKN